MRGAGSEYYLVGFGTVVSYAGDHLRRAVIETAGPSGATLQLLSKAREKMEIGQQDPSNDNPQGRIRQAAASCWAMLLARVYECLPLTCEKCGQPMRLIAFIMEPPVVESCRHDPSDDRRRDHLGKSNERHEQLALWRIVHGCKYRDSRGIGQHDPP